MIIYAIQIEKKLTSLLYHVKSCRKRMFLCETLAYTKAINKTEGGMSDVKAIKF